MKPSEIFLVAAFISGAFLVARPACPGEAPLAEAPAEAAPAAAEAPAPTPETTAPETPAPAADAGAKPAGEGGEAPAAPTGAGDFPIPSNWQTPLYRTDYATSTSLQKTEQDRALFPGSADPSAYPIHGSFTNLYRLRLVDSEHDQDFIQVLSLQAGDPMKNKVTGNFQGRLQEDIDGQPARGDYIPLGEITDTYDDNVNGRFYLGYVDLRRFGVQDALAIDTVRVGRQSFDDTAETFIFDGGRIDTKAFESLRDLKLTTYGGLPTHYYESSPSGDAVVGVGAEAVPIRNGRARVDWTYVQDQRKAILDGQKQYFQEENNLVSFALWQDLTDRLNLHGRYNLLDGESRDYLVRGTWHDGLRDLLLQGSFHHVVETLRRYSTELDPYESILFEFQPYWEVNLRASKGIGEHFVVDAGAMLRELVDDDDESTFNHEFQRYYLTPGTRDWPVKGMSISVTGEVWDGEGDEVIATGGAEISQRFLKAFMASFGSYYSLYKIDYLIGSERTHDRTFFWKLEYQVLRDLKLTGLYELERDDTYVYHRVEIGLRFSF